MTEDDSMFSNLARLQLSVLLAFVAEMTGNMAGILASLADTKITLSVYFFATPSDSDREHVEVASTEILADYPESFTLDSTCKLISELKDLRLPWLYLRAEARR